MNYKLIFLLLFAAVPAYFITIPYIVYPCLIFIILYVRWMSMSNTEDIEKIKKEQTNLKLSQAAFNEKFIPFMQSATRQIKTLEKKISTLEKMINTQHRKKVIDTDLEQLKNKFIRKAALSKNNDNE